MSTGLYDLVLAAHVLSALTALMAVGLTGLYASRARRSEDPFGTRAVNRYFRPGPNWPSRSLLLVPAFGLALLLGGDRSAVHEIWPWTGLAIWFVATGVASARVWPGERALQELLAGGTGQGPGAAALLISVSRRLERSAAVVSVLVVAAMIVMVVQPS